MRRPAMALAVVVAVLAGCGTWPTTVPPLNTPAAAALSPTPSALPSPEHTAAPTATPSPTASPSPTPTAGPTPASSITPAEAARRGHCRGSTSGKRAALEDASTGEWAGYEVLALGADLRVTCVEAEWIEPTITCSADTPAQVAIWVGMSGGNGDLVQAGTRSWCPTGQNHAAWHEVWRTEPFFQDWEMSVSAGDRIWAQVRYLGKDAFVMTVANMTSGEVSSIRQVAKGVRRLNAEWIVERPVIGCPDECWRLADLATFSPVTFKGALVTMGSYVGGIIGPWQGTALTLRYSPITYATIGPPSQSGHSFTVVWSHK